MTKNEAIAVILSLSRDEQAEITHMLINQLSQPDASKSHSILELEGLGAEIWKDLDAQEYVNQLRHEWDDRP